MAGAIGSIALGLDVAAVDGNLHRVLARIHRSSTDRKGAWALAEGHLPSGRAGDYNQALMDLGLSICSPRKPRCNECPLAAICLAGDTPDPTAWPEKKVRRKAPLRSAVAGVCRNASGEILVARRPASGLFGGLFELPGLLLPKTSRAKPGPSVLASAWLDRVGNDADVGVAHGSVVHTLTHMRLTLHVFEVSGEVPDAPRSFYDQLRWAPLEALDEMGISTLTRKALGLLESGPQQGLFTGSRRR